MKIIWFIFCTFTATQAFGVFINHKGLGEAAIIPYYTVNNNLNTLVSITNTTTQGKAIKVTIREGLHGYAALSYNVYLNAFDSWTFALLATESIVSGYAGQPSATHITFDTSCAPYLNKSGQEFLPFELVDGPSDLSRTREGFIEIIEMGSIDPVTDAFASANHGSRGVPDSCQFFQQAWEENGQWHEASGGNSQAELSPTSGGLMAEAQIIDVAEGINYSIPAIALDGFFADDTIAHVNPGDTSLSLDAAAPVAQIIANSLIYQLQFDSGIDAVSSLFMTDKLLTTFALDQVVAGISETIYSLPTRRFYVEHNDPYTLSPFNRISPSFNGCSESGYGGTVLSQYITNRNAFTFFPDWQCSGIPLCHAIPKPALCGSVFVQGYYLTPEASSPYPTPAKPFITNSRNSDMKELYDTENGSIRTYFDDARYLIGTDINSGVSYKIHGLPVFAFTLQRFTNVAADAGLLAQYGGVNFAKSFTTVEEVE